jgi:hypothetical protein
MVFWFWTEMREISVCSSVSSGCVPPWRVLVGASRSVTWERLPREDVIWPLTRVASRMDGVGDCSLTALKDRSSVDLASDDFYRTNRLPCIGRGCEVRLVVDRTPPVGGSVWSWGETVFPLGRLRPGEAGEGLHSFEGPLAGSVSSTAEAMPDSETQEGTIHLLELQPYGRVWNRWRAVPVLFGRVQMYNLCRVFKPIAIVCVHWL